MAKNTQDIFDGGYSYSRLNGGPYVIGEDFDAPAPAARVLPRIAIDPSTWETLWSFVASAIDSKSDGNSDLERFAQMMRELEFQNAVVGALRWYASDHQFQTDLPVFRKLLQGLRKSIERFSSDIPSEVSPLGHFLFNTYTGEAFLRDELKPSDCQLTQLQEAWEERAGFDAIKAVVSTMLRNIEAAQSMLGTSKPPHHRVATFVEGLARAWTKACGQPPKSGRDPMTGVQSGPFAEFVRRVNAILPQFMQIPHLDRAVRQACERDRQ